jgi:hypothetical protein
MTLRTIISNGLTHLLFLQKADKGGTNQEAEQNTRNSASERSKGDVSKNIKHRVFHMKWEEEVIEHEGRLLIFKNACQRLIRYFAIIKGNLSGTQDLIGFMTFA